MQIHTKDIMKIKNVFLAALLSVASLQIQAEDAQEQDVVVENQVQEEAAAQEVAPVVEVNPIPAEIQPYSSAVIKWAFAGQTPEERSQRASWLIKWDYANDAQIALLSTLIIALSQEAEEEN